LDTRKFDINFIVLKHMAGVKMDKRRSLPYGHIVMKLIRKAGVKIHKKMPLIQPMNMHFSLHQIGWKVTHENPEEGTIDYDINPKIKSNVWIRAPNALPNQYYDPNGPLPPPLPSVHVGEGSGSGSQMPQFFPSQDEMTNLMTLLGRLDTRTEGMENCQLAMEKRQIEMYTQIGTIQSEVTDLRKAHDSFDAWSRANYGGFYNDYIGFKTNYYKNFPSDGGDDGEPSHGGQGGQDEDMDVDDDNDLS
jgi:hypothetical protein